MVETELSPANQDQEPGQQRVTAGIHHYFTINQSRGAALLAENFIVQLQACNLIMFWPLFFNFYEMGLFGNDC